eukprot:172049_1
MGSILDTVIGADKIKEQGGLLNPIDVNKTNETFVICAGLSRTGTSSLQIALNKLGWRAYHLRNLVSNKQHHRFWLSALEKKSLLKKELKMKSNDEYDKITLNENDLICDWDKIFHSKQKYGFNACCDQPAALFYLEMIKYYNPNYKVILTVRNSEKWFNSVNKGFNCIMRLYFKSFVGSYLVSMFHRMNISSFKSFFGCIIHLSSNIAVENLELAYKDHDSSIQAYDEWTMSVTKHVNKDKLLIFNCCEGWKPLCDFLQVDIPNEPFPHSNDSAVIKNVGTALDVTIKFINYSALIAGATVCYYFWQNYGKEIFTKKYS